MWVGSPFVVGENSGSVEPAPGDDVIQVAPLTCDPFAAGWDALGTVHVFGETIIPGATYEIRFVDLRCELDAANSASAPLTLGTSLWGDVAGPFDSNAGIWTPSNGTIDITVDIVALIAKFSNEPGAMSKIRADLRPVTPNFIIDFFDIIGSIDGFRGLPFSLIPEPEPCP